MTSITLISRRRSIRRSALSALGVAISFGLVLSGCAGGDDASGGTESARVTLVVHDSFPNEEFAKAASEATGYDVEVISAGDGGELTNKLVLTKGAPIADAFFGVDTIFASRLVDNDVVEPYRPSDFPESGIAHALSETGEAVDPADAASDDPFALVPVDLGATCINIDTGWFAEQGLAEPTSYEDLTDPAYRDLTVLLDPTASSTGASFLVGTVAEFGEDGFADYWQRLLDNGARIEQGWTDAYNGQFTQGGGDGTKPIVLSYSSSPAFTVNDDGTQTSTKALLDTCSSQVEFTGVLAGASNPEGARAVIDYLVSRDFQESIPDAMYMYPVDAEAKIPEAWAKFAPLPSAGQAHDLTASEIDAGRESWLRTLGEQIGL